MRLVRGSRKTSCKMKSLAQVLASAKSNTGRQPGPPQSSFKCTLRPGLDTRVLMVKSSLGAWEDSSQSQALLSFSKSQTSVKEAAVGTSKNSNLKQTFPSLSSFPPEKERKLLDFLRCRLGLDPLCPGYLGQAKRNNKALVVERSTTGLSLWVIQHSRLEFQGTSPNPPEHCLLKKGREWESLGS